MVLILTVCWRTAIATHIRFMQSKSFFSNETSSAMCFTWREGENELEVKGVELGEEEDEDDAENRQPPFQR
jgi:hypothetical protein